MATGELAVVARHLGALWRPLPASPAGVADDVFASACAGALEELEVLAAQFPEDLTPEAVRGLRATQGLALSPGAEPGQIFVFPSPTMRSVAGGLGRFAIFDAAQGRIDLTDAAGATLRLQLGQAGGRSVLRILREGEQPQAFVGCAPTVD